MVTLDDHNVVFEVAFFLLFFDMRGAGEKGDDDDDDRDDIEATAERRNGRLF